MSSLADAWPSVSVVIPTHRRPDDVRRAVSAVLDQQYDGFVECLVVHDRCEPDASLAVDGVHRATRVLRNERTPGLAGARNTGASASTGEIIAFCDDDDLWLPGKLEAQVRRLHEADADVVTAGIRIDDGHRLSDRVPEQSELSLSNLVRHRVTGAHPSTVMVTRRAFFGVIGEVDEKLPGSYAEDYDWLLRAAQRARIVTVGEPLALVRWAPGSYFADRWQLIADAIDYLVAKHPVFADSRPGLARLYGRKAFAMAALGKRRAACSLAIKTIRLNLREFRAYAAVGVALRLVPASTLLRLAHAKGRGI